MQASNLPENNYLHYVLEDSDKKVRGHLIGVQHWVEPKDKDLNPKILQAIDRSARTILEQPPGSGLIPGVPNSFNIVIGQVIDKVIGKVIAHHKISPSANPPPLENEIQDLLKNIKEKTSDEGYKKIVNAVMSLPAKDRLKFLQAIQNKMFEFNQVSFEVNLNKRLQKANKKWEPLEKIDLSKEIAKANEKIALRLQKEKEIGKEKDISKDDEKVESNNQADEEVVMYNQAHEEELYRAWVAGDAKKLTQLLDKDFELNKEEPEIDAVHATRDKEMAMRIIDVVIQSKKEDSEAAFVMGCAHLLYTKRQNIISYLRESKDLSGWSIRQIKMNDIKDK